MIPPLLHYYRYEDKDQSWLNIWGPYFRQHTQERDMFHMLPIYWSIWGKNERYDRQGVYAHVSRLHPPGAFAHDVWAPP